MDRWQYERIAWAGGAKVVAGIDEAGRGPIAGPVVAACVILPDSFDESGIDDSKAMTEKAREAAFARIVSSARAYGIGIVDMLEIDRLNILRATHTAMYRALAAAEESLNVDVVLVDGLPVAGLHAHCTAIVKGDALSVSIGAASILAKVTRDRILRTYDAEFPEYGFAQHKGYPTPSHLRALRAHGPCLYHRRTFAPVRAAVLGEQRERGGL